MCVRVTVEEGGDEGEDKGSRKMTEKFILAYPYFFPTNNDNQLVKNLMKSRSDGVGKNKHKLT